MTIYIYTGLPGAGKSTDLKTFNGHVFKFSRRYTTGIFDSVLHEKMFLEDLVAMQEEGQLPNDVALDRFVIDEAIFSQTFKRKHHDFIWDYVVHTFKSPSVLDDVYIVHFTLPDYEEIVKRLHDRHTNDSDSVWTTEMLKQVDARYDRLYKMLDLKHEVTVMI